MRYPSISIVWRVLATAALAAAAVLAPVATQAADFTSRKTITRIAFGSCNVPEVAQPIWSAVESADPDLWIWAGDAVYADTTDIKRHRRLFRMQNEYPRYRAFKKKTRILGTWDDHDYGANNAGKEYPIKDLSQRAFLDFLDEPATSPRRYRKGIYASYLYGREGRRLKVILLDVRYHRDPPGTNADILGSSQWEWLESEIKEPDSNLILLVSGTVVTTYEHIAEKWADYPLAKERLFRAISASPVPVAILSGDVHFGEISRITIPHMRWPLVEVTSSGMTHSTRGAYYKSSIRVGSIYYGLNFGLVEINWEDYRVSLQVRDTDGLARTSDTLDFRIDAN